MQRKNHLKRYCNKKENFIMDDSRIAKKKEKYRGSAITVGWLEADHAENFDQTRNCVGGYGC